jgi:hypothetical protein
VNTGYSARANETQYHNGILVDGNGELGDVRSSDTEWNNAWFYERDAVPLIEPASTIDYAVTGGRGASLYDPALGLTRFDRVLVLARNRYALVHDDLTASTARTFDWLCHFSDGANVDTASGWVQGIDKNGMSLGVRVVSPASWTATTGAQSANLTLLFEADGSIAYVKVRPASASSSQQFLTALMPVATGQWGGRPVVTALTDAEPGAGMVVAPGSALEERWIFARAGGDGKAASGLALTASLVGMAAYNHGQVQRSFVVGAGKLSDQNGTRELLSTHTARALEADLQGTSLVVSGDGIRDFRAYAPDASQVIVNGRSVAWKRNGTAVEFVAADGEDTGSGGTAAASGNGQAAFLQGGCATGGASLWSGIGLLAGAWALRRKRKRPARAGGAI